MENSVSLRIPRVGRTRQEMKKNRPDKTMRRKRDMRGIIHHTSQEPVARKSRGVFLKSEHSPLNFLSYKYQ